MAVAIQADQVRQHGGGSGIRDVGLLDSALDRPRNRWSYDSESDLPALAAAYCVGVARNHPFVDGNKRVAFLVAYVFLGLNGLRVETDEPDVVDTVLRVATGDLSEEALADWFRARVQPR